MRKALSVRDIIAVAALVISVSVTHGQVWNFSASEDAFSSSAVLDLSGLNEAQAGSHGFLRVTADGDFQFADGTPVRFWCVGSSYAKNSTNMSDIQHHANWMAKRGVNMARMHAFIDPDGGSGTGINTAERDGLFRHVAGFKQAGIYTTFSPYWAVACNVGSGWGLPEYTGESPMALLFFHPTLIGYYKQWMRQVLTTTNPHTGLALKDDPALAIIQLQNEDSFLFNTIDGLKPGAKHVLKLQFGQWLTDKYGSLDSALAAWDGASHPADTFASGIVEIVALQNLTVRQPQVGRNQRMSDQLEFFTWTMYTFNEKMGSFLRDSLGCQQIINAGNWKTSDDVTLSDHERYSYSANEVIAKNHYYGGKHTSPNGTEGWAIQAGDFYTDPSGLLNPRRIPVNFKQVHGMPSLITESNWVPPLGYQSEAPFLVAVYSALTGQDGYYWFNAGEREWRDPASANGYLPSIGKWVCQTPNVAGMWPAAALLFRWGYVQQGAPVVFERRALQDMWDRWDPIIAETSGYDPNRDDVFPPDAVIPNGVNPLAFLVGPVRVEYDADPAATAVADIDSYVDTTDSVVTSATGQVRLDYGAGICQVNSNRAQGVCGFLNKVGTFTLDDVQITTTNTYASILVVPLDAAPIAESKHVLVQAGTMERPTNWQVRAADVGGEPGFEILAHGNAPWRIQNIAATVGIKNASLSQMAVLDMNGMELSTSPLTTSGEYQQAQLPADKFYVVFRDPGSPLRITEPKLGAASGPSVGLRGASLNVSGVGKGQLQVMDLRGRTVRLSTVRGSAAVSLAGDARGVRVVQVRGEDGKRIVRPVAVVR